MHIDLSPRGKRSQSRRFGFMGVTDITFVHVEKDQFDSEGLAQSIANARSKISQLVAT